MAIHRVSTDVNATGKAKYVTEPRLIEPAPEQSGFWGVRDRLGHGDETGRKVTMILARLSALEATALIFTIITGVVLAGFAVMAFVIQRSRFIRELYRPIDFQSIVFDSEPIHSDSNVRSLHYWFTGDSDVVTLSFTNPNQDPMKLDVVDSNLFGYVVGHGMSHLNGEVFGNSTVYPNEVGRVYIKWLTEEVNQLRIGEHSASGERLAQRPSMWIMYRFAAESDLLSKILMPRNWGYRWRIRRIYGDVRTLPDGTIDIIEIGHN